MGDDLVIVGGGGHGREVLDVIEAVVAGVAATGLRVLGVLDDGHPDLLRLAARGLRVLGGVDHLATLEEVGFGLGIGSATARRALGERLAPLGRPSPALRHPAATVGSLVVRDAGSVLAAGARLTTNVVVGAHAYVGPNATVGHDCLLAPYATLYPGAVVSGNVTVGEAATVGAGATVRQGVHLGDGCFVGAGAVVLDDVEPGTTVVGVPARPRRPAG